MTSLKVFRTSLARKEPIYTKENKRILALLDEPPELCDIDVQYVWRFLRNQKIDHRASARFYWYLGKAPPEVFISGIRSRVDKDVLTHLSNVLGVDVEHTAAVSDHPIFFVYEDLPENANGHTEGVG
jgi:hypothetical protein